jgi:sterol desaturase/sphingolipid hydroxylase (fatty acid hydroxylase superfamily)
MVFALQNRQKGQKMTAIDEVLGALISMPGLLLIAFLCSAVLSTVFRKKEQLGRLAISNIATSFIIAMLNMAAWVLFAQQISVWVQGRYDALNIPTLDPQIWQHVPVWLGMLVTVLAADFVDYWSHRLMHTRLGWLTHAAHHTDTHVNAFTNFRIHVLETIVMLASYTLMLTWMQLPEMIPVVILATRLLGFYVHLDVDIHHGPFRYLLSSPRFHRWHHADVPEAYGKNLANIFPFYDLMFGTYYVPGRCTAPMGAQSAGIDGISPLKIYAFPFVEAAKMAKALARRLTGLRPKTLPPQQDKSQQA